MTNPVLTAISDRRSIRQYKPQQITKEQLQALLRAAVEAPSARRLRRGSSPSAQFPQGFAR